MSYQVIWEKFDGDLIGELPVVVQGSTLETITILALYRDGSNVDLSGMTVTATMTDRSQTTYGMTGSFVGADGSFAWTPSAGDVGTAGNFSVIVTYSDGSDVWRSDPVQLVVVANPSATAVQNDALVGVTSEEAAWLTAGLAAGGAATEDNLASFSAAGVPEDSGVAKTAVGNATKLQARTLAGTAPTDGQAVVWNDGAAQWEPGDVSADTSALLPKSAGSGEALTGTLYLDPGSDDAAQVLKIPVTDSDGADFNANLAKAAFSGTDDITFNWGFNNSAAGPENGAKHAWYLQLEYDFYSGGNHYVEYHLNLYPDGGGTTRRPMQFQFLKDASDGAIFFSAANYYVQSIGGTQTLQFTQLGTANAKFRIDAKVQLQTPAASDAFNIISATNNLPVMALDGTVNDLSLRARLIYIKNAATGSTFMTINTTVDTVNLGGLLGRLSVEMPNDSYKGIVVKRAATQTKNLLEIQNNSGAVQFGINPDGRIWTNQAAANTATPSGATAYQLPFYNAAGTLLGYIPIYASAWT